MVRKTERREKNCMGLGQQQLYRPNRKKEADILMKRHTLNRNGHKRRKKK